jgi:hypothetical protein
MIIIVAGVLKGYSTFNAFEQVIYSIDSIQLKYNIRKVNSKISY